MHHSRIARARRTHYMHFFLVVTGLLSSSSRRSLLALGGLLGKPWPQVSSPSLGPRNMRFARISGVMGFSIPTALVDSHQFFLFVANAHLIGACCNIAYCGRQGWRCLP